MHKVPLTPFVLASLVDAWIDARSLLDAAIDNHCSQKTYQILHIQENFRAQPIGEIIKRRTGLREPAWPWDLGFWIDASFTRC